MPGSIRAIGQSVFPAGLIRLIIISFTGDGRHYVENGRVRRATMLKASLFQSELGRNLSGVRL
jgi:hypothetical protein